MLSAALSLETRTQAGLLKEADIPLRTAAVLEALALEDENLQNLSSNLAAELWQMAKVKRAMAPVADVEWKSPLQDAQHRLHIFSDDYLVGLLKRRSQPTFRDLRLIGTFVLR